MKDLNKKQVGIDDDNYTPTIIRMIVVTIKSTYYYYIVLTNGELLAKLVHINGK